MKRSVITLILFLCTTAIALGQIEEYTFGKVDKADLEMTVYPMDSGASAVYLLKKGISVMRPNDLAVMLNTHVRIKILNEEGLEWADLQIRYLKVGGELTKLKAATHNLVDGKVVTRKIGKREWVEEKVNDRVKSKKLSFPDAKVGSIIEYSYSIKAGDIGNIPSWSFQSSIPVRYSEYKAQLSQYAAYMPLMKGYHAASYSDTRDGVYHIVMKEVPALTEEPYVSTIENFRSGIEFEIKSVSVPGYPREVFMENWEAINEELMESDGVGGALSNTGSLRRIYPEEKGWTNNKESLIDIYKYVRDHFTWNGRTAYSVVDSGKELWKEGEGDNADINVTLAQFLNKAGIEVSPVVLSTRGHGYVNQYMPIASQFNYMILQASVDGDTVLMDATDKYRPYNVLPERALNGKGLLLNPYGPKWIDLNMNKEMNSKVITGEFTFNEDMELTGEMEISFRSVAGSRLRAELYEEMEKKKVPASEESDEGDENDALEDYKAGEVEDLEVVNLTDPLEALQLKYNFTVSDGINMIGDKIFMSPVLIKHISENPFKLEERLYPVEMSCPVNDTYVFKINLPEGYEIEELPKSQRIRLPNRGGSYMYNVGQIEGGVQVMVRLSLTQTEYDTNIYGNLKELFNIILSKQDQQIVLKQKSE